MKKGLVFLPSVNQKTDFKYFSENLLSFLHEMFISKFGIGSSIENSFSAEDLKTLIQLFSQAHSQIKYSVSPQIPFEIAVMEFCSTQVSDLPVEEVTSEKVEPKTHLVNDDKILTELIEKVNSENKTLAALLRGVRLEKDDKNVLILITSYKFHKERLDDPKSKEIIEKMYYEVTGKNKKIQINLGGDK